MKKLSILDSLIKLDGILSLNNIMDIVFRSIGWYIVRFCSWLLDGVYKVSDEIYSLLNFTKSPEIAKFIGDYMFLIKILFGLAITFLGIYLIVKKVDNSMNISQNLLLILLVVVCMPVISTKMFALTNSSINYAKSHYSNEKHKVASTIIADNMIDFKVVDDKYAIKDKGMSKKCTEKKLIKNKKKYNKVNSLAKKGKNIGTYIDINETIELDDDDIKSGIWEKKLVGDAQGNDKVTDLNDGIFQYDERYFRYSVSWGTLLFTLIATTIGLVFTSFKVARLIFEIAWTQMLSPFFAVTDIQNGQRIKTVLTHLVSMFAALFLIAAMLGLYFMSIKWLSGQQKRISELAYIIALLAVTWLLIDGPNIIERVIGVDAGLQSGYKAAMATYMGVKTGVKGVKNGVKLGMATGSAADNLVRGKKGVDGQRHGGIVGAAKAYKEGMKDTSLQSPSYNEKIANNEQSSKDNSMQNQERNKNSNLKGEGTLSPLDSPTEKPNLEQNGGGTKLSESISKNPPSVSSNLEQNGGGTVLSESTPENPPSVSSNLEQNGGGTKLSESISKNPPSVSSNLEQNGGGTVLSESTPENPPSVSSNLEQNGGGTVLSESTLENPPKGNPNNIKQPVFSKEQPTIKESGTQTSTNKRVVRKNNLHIASKGLKYSAQIPKNLSSIKTTTKETIINKTIKSTDNPVSINKDKRITSSEKIKKDSILNKTKK